MMIMRKTALLLMICCAVVACKKNDVQFTYSPTQPHAGEVVRFSNLSSSGEEWAWSFGDGATSTLKFPSHTYTKPGTYTVILKVDDKSSWTATAELVVVDTIPTYVCSDSVFTIFKDYTFTANLYNPYNYDVEYEWSLGEYESYAHLTDTTAGWTANTLSLYFIQANPSITLSLRVILNGDTTLVKKSFNVTDRATNSVLMRTPEADYRQRIFGARSEEYKEDATADSLLTAEQDIQQVYNDSTFTLENLQQTFPGIRGFHIANRKIYFRTDGLWVANIDGAYQVQIDERICDAMTLDLTDNRIYWANADGVWYMPFIGSDNNQFVTKPTLLNPLTDVTKIAADGELK